MCFPFRFDLESSRERKVISYFYIRSCLIAYGFITFGAGTRDRIPLGNSENLDLNQLRIRVACLICLIARGNPGMAEKKKVMQQSIVTPTPPPPPTSGNSGDMDFQRCHDLKFPNPLEHSSL